MPVIWDTFPFYRIPSVVRHAFTLLGTTTVGEKLILREKFMNYQKFMIGSEFRASVIDNLRHECCTELAWYIHRVPYIYFVDLNLERRCSRFKRYLLQIDVVGMEVWKYM